MYAYNRTLVESNKITVNRVTSPARHEVRDPLVDAEVLTAQTDPSGYAPNQISRLERRQIHVRRVNVVYHKRYFRKGNNNEEVYYVQFISGR